MKLERSDTWTGTGRPVWRVTSWYFAWGPWCHNRRDAIRQWRRAIKLADIREFLSMPFVRLYRWLRHDCVVCGRGSPLRPQALAEHYRYCSLECSAYDGALRNPKKSWVLYGRLVEPKRHHDADMKGHVEPSEPWPRV